TKSWMDPLKNGTKTCQFLNAIIAVSNFCAGGDNGKMLAKMMKDFLSKNPELIKTEKDLGGEKKHLFKIDLTRYLHLCNWCFIFKNYASVVDEFMSIHLRAKKLGDSLSAHWFLVGHPVSRTIIALFADLGEKFIERIQRGGRTGMTAIEWKKILETLVKEVGTLK